MSVGFRKKPLNPTYGYYGYGLHDRRHGHLPEGRRRSRHALQEPKQDPP